MKSTIIILSLFFTYKVHSTVKIKIGILAPEGSTWSKYTKAIVKEVEEKTKKNVKIKVYYGGSQGDDIDVLRKIRIGQMHGGVFTGRALSEISGDLRVMELPFNFLNTKVSPIFVLDKMEKYFNEITEKNGFINLGYIGLGHVYFASTKKPLVSLKDTRGAKIWIWQNDPFVKPIIEELKLSTVSLPLPDVLAALSTGIVEVVYGPTSGMVALQWHTKIKYITDLKVAYSTAAVLVSKKIWNKIPVNYQKSVKEIFKKHIKLLNIAQEKDNKDSINAMKSLGIRFYTYDKKSLQDVLKRRKEIIKKMINKKSFSKKSYDILRKALQQ